MNKSSFLIAAIFVVGLIGFGVAALYLKDKAAEHSLGTPMGQDDDTVAGQVTQVISGDSMVVTVAGKTPLNVHLFGVVTPDLNEPFGKEARDQVERWTRGQGVLLRLRGVEDSRVLGEIILPNTRDLSHLLLKAGLARWDDGDEPNNKQLERLQTEAQRLGLGIWEE